MTQLSRSEKISVMRGILQFVGILMMIVAVIVLLKYKEVVNKECGWRTIDDTIETTGLYGNCSWLNNKDIETYNKTDYLDDLEVSVVRYKEGEMQTWTP